MDSGFHPNDGITGGITSYTPTPGHTDSGEPSRIQAEAGMTGGCRHPGKKLRDDSCSSKGFRSRRASSDLEIDSGGCTAQQNTLDLGGQGLGPVAAFFVREAGKGMLSHHVLVIRHPHHAGHGLGGVVENVGDDRRRGYAQALHFDAVVHTARAAGASIADPGDEDVHLVQHVLYGCLLGGQGSRVFAEIQHLSQSVLLLEDLT